MVLWWGPRHIQFYNDSYRPLIGGRHPKAMGQSASDCFKDIWPTIGPMLKAPLRGEPATWSDDLLLLFNRSGFAEETHFKVSYSPVPDETVPVTGVGGVLGTISETTQQVYSERQLRTLRDLGARSAEARTVEHACEIAAATLKENPADVPFALFYIMEADGKRARLAASCGFVEEDGAANPSFIDLETPAANASWPLRRVAETRRIETVMDLAARFGALPKGPWAHSPHSAKVLPLAAPEQPRPYGFLIAGLSPHRILDAGYRTFLGLCATQVFTAIRNVLALQEERIRVEKLAEIDRAKTTFFSNVSHEFRTPLTLMLGPLEEALSDSTLTPLQENRVELVYRNGLRLLKLVNTLLDFSRIEAGRTQAIYEPVELACFTADLAGVFRAAIEKAGLRLRVDCPPLPAPVHVDKEMWEKIVFNLLSNAFKFTFEGEIEVSLRPKDDRVELRVRDTGVGIPEADRPRLFERFHRVHNARARTYEGTGIGLALVQELSKLHGGCVRLESAEGVGSEFIVEIPGSMCPLPREKAGGQKPLISTALQAKHFTEEALRWLPSRLETTMIAAPSEPAVVRTARILLADDNADMRDYVKSLLSPHWIVDTASDGAAALAKIRETSPDLVLTDVMMPQLDGLGLLRELRADPKTQEIPVIFLSARAGEQFRMEGLASGVDDYLVKPFTATELIARVSSHLKHSGVRRQALATLRQSEDRFRGMADNAPVMIWVTGPDGECNYLNKSWYEFTGQTEEQGLKSGWLDAVHPDDRAGMNESFTAANAKQAVYRAEYKLLRKDGEHRWVIDSAAPRLGAQGEFLGYIGTVLDVTEFKESECLQREFIANASHELRTPLAVVQGSAETLRKGGFKDVRNRMKFVLLIEKQADRLRHLVENLLELSHLESGRYRPNIEPVPLRQFIHKLLAGTRQVARKQGVNIRINIPVEHRVLADKAQLAQVVQNLCDNAVKYNRQKGRVVIEARVSTTETVVVFKDTGIGIARKDLAHVFDRFHRTPGARVKAPKGSGLGLAIAKNIIEAHGGRIWVESREGKGSDFHFALPRTRT
jgi:PAS domain S-box-containing protein